MLLKTGLPWLRYKVEDIEDEKVVKKKMTKTVKVVHDIKKMLSTLYVSESVVSGVNRDDINKPQVLTREEQLSLHGTYFNHFVPRYRFAWFKKLKKSMHKFLEQLARILQMIEDDVIDEQADMFTDYINSLWRLREKVAALPYTDFTKFKGDLHCLDGFVMEGKTAWCKANVCDGAVFKQERSDVYRTKFQDTYLLEKDKLIGILQFVNFYETLINGYDMWLKNNQQGPVKMLIDRGPFSVAVFNSCGEFPLAFAGLLSLFGVFQFKLTSFYSILPREIPFPLKPGREFEEIKYKDTDNFNKCAKKYYNDYFCYLNLYGAHNSIYENNIENYSKFVEFLTKILI